MSSSVAPRIRVFLVEDQTLVRETLRALLEHEQEIEIIGEAGTAEQALQELGSLQPQVVLMDIGLPGISSIEATYRLKQRRPDLPVVMLTAYADDEVANAIEAGATGYLLKTCTRQQLVDAIKSADQGHMPIDPAVAGTMAQELRALRKTHRESLLTDRQLQVLRLVADGTPYGDIASALYVSVTTVNREMRTIFDRLGVNDAAHAVSEAYTKGIL